MHPSDSLSRQELRNVDRCATECLGVPGVVLMENAGRNVADAIEDFLGGLTGRSVAIVAGAGNNGGDGFVVASHLAMRGAKVTTFLTCPPEKLSSAPDAKINFDIITKLGHDIRQTVGQDIAGLAGQLKGFDLIVDAVGGTGISGPLRGDTAVAVEQINAAGRAVVAIDIPTGLDCDTGQAAGPAVRARMTVTMFARKKGFDAPGASAYTGEIRVVDIGIPASVAAAVDRGQAPNQA
jgi:NAD(P)H-hydrate epimerase